MVELTVFNFKEYKIREITDGKGNPWFVAADVCKVLDLDTSLSVNGRWRKSEGGEVYHSGGLDEDEKDTAIVSTPGGIQQMLIVNEAGLYSLILKSRKPEAKAFKRWIIHEVIPSIRKIGSYSIQRKLPTYPEALRQLADALEREERNKPKIEAYNHLINAENLQPWNVVAKALGTGRKRLLEFLRQQKILMSNNTPYQQYIDRGYFVVKEKTFEIGDVFRSYPQTFVSAKGVDFISKLWREAHMLTLIK